MVLDMNIDQILKEFQPLFVSLSNRYYRQYYQLYFDIDDLIQIARIQVWKQIHLYDPNRSKLSSFIYLICTRAILNYIRDNTKGRYWVGKWDDMYDIAKESEKLIDYLPKLSKVEKQILDDKLSEYTIEEIADRLNLNTFRIKKILESTYKRIVKVNPVWYNNRKRSFFETNQV